jgi:lipoprotein-releasing system ATP-binding protein
MKKTMVRVRALVKDYASPVETLHILRGLDFDIEQGESAAITGNSGSGKSTLLNILGGLDKCDSGEVTVDGDRIDALAEKHLTRYRRKSVGLIFQFHYLLNDFTALENVMLPAFIAGASRKTALEKARVLLADVGMEERAQHLPRQLSGGERQRVAVARSIVNDPALLLADEPTGNLDGKNTALVTDILYGAAEKWGKTLIVVTHDENVASRAARRFTLANGVLEERKN